MTTNIAIKLGPRGHFIDVFKGDGWENWGRYVLEKDILHHRRGIHITIEEANAIINLIKGNLNASTNQSRSKTIPSHS